MENVIVIENKDHFNKALKDAGDKAVIVDFTATWCGPCRQIGPVFVVYSKTYTTVVFLKVDVDECEDVAAEQGISAMPTFKVYKNGKMVKEMVGASKDKLEQMIKEFA